MKNKILILVLLFSLTTIGLIGCGEEKIIYTNVEDDEKLNSANIGKDAMIEIGSGLYYDSSTRIVYWWNGYLSLACDNSTVPSPYYAPNGLPYRYNPETNTFEEIN